jgi:hypothetical protein
LEAASFHSIQVSKPQILLENPIILTHLEVHKPEFSSKIIQQIKFSQQTNLKISHPNNSKSQYLALIIMPLNL